MLIECVHTLDADVERCWEMIRTPDFHVRKFEQMGHHNVEIVAQELDDHEVYFHIARDVEVDQIPAFARKFFSPKNHVVSHDRWSAYDDGTFAGEFSAHSRGVPVKVSGTTLLEPDGSRTTYTITTDVRINIPLVGNRFNGYAEDLTRMQFAEEYDLADQWLAEHT